MPSPLTCGSADQSSLSIPLRQETLVSSPQWFQLYFFLVLNYQPFRNECWKSAHVPACRKAALEEGHLRTKMRTCVSFLPTCIAIRKRLVRQLAVSGANQPAVARLQVHKYIDTIQERKEKVVLYPWFLFVSRVISSSSTYIQYRDDLLQISRTTHQSTSQRRHSISQLIVYHRARTTSIWETKKVFRYIKGGRAHLDCHQRRLYEYEMDRAAQGFFLFYWQWPRVVSTDWSRRRFCERRKGGAAAAAVRKAAR